MLGAIEVILLTYLGRIISKDGGSSEDVNSRIAKAQGVFSKNWKNKKINQQTKTRISETTLMTLVNYGTKA